METLLEASKSAQGRQELVYSGKLADAAGKAAQVFTELCELKSTTSIKEQAQQVVLLRLLRNACALGAAAASLLLQRNIPRIVAAAAAHVAVCCHNLQQQLLTTTSGKQECKAASDKQLHSELQQQEELLLPAVQLLHNLSATGAEGAAAVWATLFPTALNSILLSNQGHVHEAVALTCLSCARSSTQALADLTSTAAATAWHRLLAQLKPQTQQESAAQAAADPVPSSAAAGGDPGDKAAAEQAVDALPALPPGNDNVCLLVKFLAMQHNKLQQLMQLLSEEQPPNTSITAPGATLQASEQHAVLLHVVALEAAAVPAASPLPGLTLTADAGLDSSSSGNATDWRAGSSWLQYVVQLLQGVWGQALAAADQTSGVCSSPTATGHLLEALLQVLKAVLARDEDAAGDMKPGKEAEAAAAAGLASVAQYLHSQGLLQQLLNMLTALGPPPKPKQQQQRELEEQHRRQQLGQAKPQQQEPQPQHQQPYAGYRADVVAVLSNMLLGGREVQDAVMSSGGIELLLNNCNLDDSAPMAREWALWGIRNACRDNAVVQGYVSQFQAVDAVQSPELDRMGMQLELDQMTHKLKLSKKPDTR